VETTLRVGRVSLFCIAVLLTLLLSGCNGNSSAAGAPVAPTSQSPPAGPTVGAAGIPDLPTLAPPLAPLELPVAPVEYPEEWPEALRLPAEFTPVDLTSGSMPGVDDPEWSAGLRYARPPLDAADALTVHFERQGWSVVRRDFGGTGVLLTIELDSTGSGMVVIDADTATDGAAVILALVRLAS
jgi:hypothetical protein